MTNYFLRALVDWVFRRRSTGLTLVRIGASLLAVVLLGLTIGVTIPTAQGPLVFNWDSSGSTGAVSWTVLVIASLVVLIGLGLIIRDIREESRKKVIVIEARGLRDWQGLPLASAVPRSIPGRRESMIVDLRQGLFDGQIVIPDVALRRLAGLTDDVARRCSGLARQDISFVLGGLAPVPFLFLLGVIVDDESRTYFMDWDRTRHDWRDLSEEDDGKRFLVTGLEVVNAQVRRVALCVSASYDVQDANVQVAEPGVPIIKMELDGRNTSSHWSERKQQQLAQQFLDTVMALARQGVNEISLFLAAPASLTLRLGTLYDKRNLPHVEVNQFEQGDPKRFPWAVRMPVSGVSLAEVRKR